MSLRDIIDINQINIETVILETITLTNEESYYSYSGELNENKKPHGYGLGIFKDFKYCGTWNNGIQDGDGIKYCTQNNKKLKIRYIGFFKGALLQGYGKIYINNYLYYEGNFTNNKYNGFGKIYYNNKKTRFVGLFKANLRDGNGKLYDIKGNLLYDGEFKQDKKSGEGKSYDPNFSLVSPVYSGEWDNDMYNGKGLINYTFGDYYSGYFVNNKKEGKGKIYYNNNCYEGDFKDDKKNGKGILKIYNKSSSRSIVTYDGIFSNDVLIGYCKITYKNGDIYEGNIENYKKQGFGIYTCYKTKNKYEGNWKDDLKDGNIVIINENNETFKTIWKNGKQINKKRYEKEYVDDEQPIKKVRKEIPVEYKCPISLFVMKDPVIASDGNTYERSSLEDLFKKTDKVNSPLTREILDKNLLISNNNLKKLIEDMLADDPLVLHM
jgi:hypothetical protein